jgi:hypothetical protein
MLACWRENKAPDMRIFTGRNNPFGGSGNKDMCMTLISGTLKCRLEEGNQNPPI